MGESRLPLRLFLRPFSRIFLRCSSRSSLPYVGVLLSAGVVSCTAILGLDELPLRPACEGCLDGSTPQDSSTSVPPEASPGDAGVDARDSAPPPCDPLKLATDPSNCGACGRVCRSVCSAGACDADRLVEVAGAPRGLFVAGNTVYFGTLDGTTATIASCPVAGPCESPKVERTESADDVRLLAALPTMPASLVFSVLARPSGETRFFVCDSGACTAATPLKTEGGVVTDAAHVLVSDTSRWIFYTTATTAVAYGIPNNFSQIVASLRGSQLLGHNGKYLWARTSTGFQRVALDSPTLAATSLPLSDFPDARQFVWNGGATTLFVSNSQTSTCAGATADCVTRVGCTLAPAPPFFGFDATHVVYARGTELVTAPYETPCAPQKVLAEASPALPVTGRSIGLEASSAVWIETAGTKTRVFRRAR